MYYIGAFKIALLINLSSNKIQNLNFKTLVYARVSEVHLIKQKVTPASKKLRTAKKLLVHIIEGSYPNF